jgi:hypothetical protein
MPRYPPWTDHILGQSSNPADAKFVSPQADKAKIAVLIVAVDRIIDRCDETMNHWPDTSLVAPEH